MTMFLRRYGQPIVAIEVGKLSYLLTRVAADNLALVKGQALHITDRDGCPIATITLGDEVIEAHNLEPTDEEV